MDNWSVTITPKNKVVLGTANTFVDRDIDIAMSDIIQEKTYEEVTCTANDDPNAWLYFGTLKPTDNYAVATIKFRVYMNVPRNANNASYYMYYDYIGDVKYTYARDTLLAYTINNNIANTSYRALYSHVVYRAKTANVSTDGHVLGFRFQSSTNPNNANYKRTVRIEIIELENATFEFSDTMKTWANYGKTTDNYAGRSEYNGTTQGLQETGDADSGNYNIRDLYLRPYLDANLYRYKLCGLGANNRLVPLVTTNQTSTTLVAKTVNTTPFRASTGLWYYNSTTTYNSGSVVGASLLYAAISSADLRYTFNGTIGATTVVPAYMNVYIKGNYNPSTDMFTIATNGQTNDSSWQVLVPQNSATITLSNYFETGKYYMLVGYSYSSADSVSLTYSNPVYYFDGYNLRSIATPMKAIEENFSRNNMIVRKDETVGYYIDTDGSDRKASNHAIATLIPVKPNTEYTLSRSASTLVSAPNFRCSWYNSSQTYISRFATPNESYTVTSPATAAYMRVSYPIDCFPKLEEGTCATEWKLSEMDLKQSNTLQIVTLTQEEYDLIETPSNTTMYVIVG